MGSAEASPMLVQLLREKDVKNQLEVMHAMHDWPLTQAVAIELARATSSPSDLVRFTAVDLLVHDRSRFMDVLLYLGTAHWGEGQLGEYEGLEVIAVYPRVNWGAAVSCLTSRNPRSARLAQDMVSRMGPRAIPWLTQIAGLAGNQWTQERGNIKLVYESVCHSLEGTGEPTKTELKGIEPKRLLESLLSIIGNQQLDPGLKVIALGPLQRFGDNARPAVAQTAGLLSNPLPDSEQARVLDFLSQYAPVGYAANQGAIRALAGSSVELRVAAEHYLAIAGTSVYPQLLQLLHGSPNEALSAIHVMQTLPAPDKVLADGLVQQLSNGDPEVRRAAIALLETWLSPRSTTQPQSVLIDCRGQVRPLTSDPDPVVREHAEAIVKLLNIALADTAVSPAIPAAIPPATIHAALPIAWHHVFVAVTVLLLVAVAGGWIVVHSLSKQAQSHIQDSTKIKCERCRAIIPEKSRFCRRCGLTVPGIS
jgi:HEAT repeat protein/ribosomal protein L40E